MWPPKKNSRIIALHCVRRQAECTSHASQRSQAKSNDADAKDDNQSSHLRGHLRLLHEGPIIKHFNAETSQPWPWNMMQNIAMINKTVGNVAVILFWVTRREPMFWLQTTRSLASLDRLWVAANVKYLDLAEPAYVENQRANDIRGKQTWRATFHHASTRHHKASSNTQLIPSNLLGQNMPSELDCFLLLSSFHMSISKKNAGNHWISYQFLLFLKSYENFVAKNFIHDPRLSHASKSRASTEPGKLWPSGC